MSSDTPASTRIIARTVLNVLIIWALSTYLGGYVHLTGGIWAAVVIGALITLMNMIARPILEVVTLPFKLFATLLAVILVNGVFIALIVFIASKMDPSIVTFTIGGGVGGWIVVALVFGFAEWIVKSVTK